MNKPISTYRLQLRKELGFREATELVDWLSDLGVTHAYVSPYLMAQPGSTHGYDLVDPTRLDPQLGTEADYEAWTRALAERGMGHIVDVVPNHMAATTRNKWWHDVLENGPSSPYADYFDVEWHPPKAALVDKVLLPVLGAQYGEVLEKGELRLERHDGAFCVRYWERCLPVNPPSVAPVLERAASALAMPASDPRRQELESIVTGLRHLPASHETDPARRAERQREKEVLKRRLAAACADPEIAAVVDREV
ncbi:MAG TPA: alpha-amylase family glycosyl hydrolase, partial [Labilithrix sp.]